MKTIVAGPPAAGKSTYVCRHASPGALVVDFDQIAVGLGSPHPWDHPGEIRQEAHREVERRMAAAANADEAWVIRSAPEPSERLRLAGRLGADRIVVLATPALVAKRRAVADGRPDWTAAAIDRWWARYRPSKLDSDPEG